RWRGEGRRRVRVWGELGLSELRIDESHINHDLLLKAVCPRMATATLPARRPSAEAVPGRCGACLAVRTPPVSFFAAHKSQVSHHRGRTRLGTLSWSGRGRIGRLRANCR